MNMLTLITEGVRRELQSEKIFGVVVGLVTNNQDDEGLDRVKVKFPWLSEDEESHWARVSCPMAGKERGILFLPEVDDEVLVAFEHGDIDWPVRARRALERQGQAAGDQRRRQEQHAAHQIAQRTQRAARRHRRQREDRDRRQERQELDRLATPPKNTITISADKDIVLKAPTARSRSTRRSCRLKSSSEVKAEDVEAGGGHDVKGPTVNLN